MVVMGVSSVPAFWGHVLRDELKHQESKTPPLLVNTKVFPEELVRKLFPAPPWLLWDSLVPNPGLGQKGAAGCNS